MKIQFVKELSPFAQIARRFCHIIAAIVKLFASPTHTKREEMEPIKN
jgi:hypothetical protein